MHKRSLSKKDVNLSRNKLFWNQVVDDVTAKISEARKRLDDLEAAQRIFRRNAEKGASIPGGPDNDATQSPSV